MEDEGVFLVNADCKVFHLKRHDDSQFVVYIYRVSPQNAAYQTCHGILPRRNGNDELWKQF